VSASLSVCLVQTTYTATAPGTASVCFIPSHRGPMHLLLARFTHRSMDAGCCYRCRMCIRLSVCAKTDEPIELPFERDSRRPTEPRIDGGTYGRHLANTIGQSNMAAMRAVATITHEALFTNSGRNTLATCC